jgi:hypothetical protein
LDSFEKKNHQLGRYIHLDNPRCAQLPTLVGGCRPWSTCISLCSRDLNENHLLVLLDQKHLNAIYNIDFTWSLALNLLVAWDGSSQTVLPKHGTAKPVPSFRNQKPQTDQMKAGGIHLPEYRSHGPNEGWWHSTVGPTTEHIPLITWTLIPNEEHQITDRGGHAQSR